jgi:hypothetical protein
MLPLLIPYSIHPPSHTESGDFRLRSSARLANSQGQSWRATNTAELPMKDLGRHRDIDNPILRTPLLSNITPPTVTKTSPRSPPLLQASRGGVEVVSPRDHHASRGVVTLFPKSYHNGQTCSLTLTKRHSFSKRGVPRR